MAQEKYNGTNTPKEYFAFISYKREDEKWAEWLQHKLEHYRLPVNVRKENAALPQTIRPIFKDTSELAAGVLAEEIRNALENSKFLIVVCSPRAAQSEWVGKEVQTFIDMGRSDKIIPFIIGGTPFSQNPEEECFPAALLNLPKEQELLGVNINEMGRDAAVVKVVARMFGLKFDTLWQRYEREQKKRRRMLVGGALLFALVSLAVGAYFVRQNGIIEDQKEQLQTQTARLMEDSVTMANHILRIQEDSLKLSTQNDSITHQNTLILQQRNNLDRTNQQLQLSNQQLAEERDNVKNANTAMMTNRAHFISQEAMQLISEGDTYRAILLLLEILPDSNHPDRPYVAEAEKILRIAMDSLNRDGYVPIAHLDHQDDRASFGRGIQDVYYDADKHTLWIQLYSGDSGDQINCYDIKNGALCDSYNERENEDYERIKEACHFSSAGIDSISDQYYFENKTFKVTIHDSHCVLYSLKSKENNVIHYELPIDFFTERFNKSVFSGIDPFMIIGDTIYNYLSGKAIRPIGISAYGATNGIYSSDDKYIIAMSADIFYIEDAQTGKILNKLDYKKEYNVDDSFIDFFSRNGTLCISSGFYNQTHDIFTLPNLRHVYHGNNYHEFYHDKDFIFDCDSEKGIVWIKNANDSSIIKTIYLDLSYVRNNYETYNFELLDKHTLYIEGLMSAMIYDIHKNTIARKWQYHSDRYEGGFFSSKKDYYVSCSMHGDVKIYDPLYGELFYSFYNEDWEKRSVLHGYDCSFTKKEDYIVYLLENNNMSEDEATSVDVIKWDNLNDIMIKAQKETRGRSLSNIERKIFYVE